MNSTIKKTTVIFSIFIVTALILLSYYLIASFSESKRYSKNSLDYLLLTPGLLKNQPLADIYNVEYYYSAADGNKPTVYAMTFFTHKSQDDIKTNFENYLKSLGHTKNEGNIFSKDNQKVSIKYSLSQNQEMSVTFSIMEYLSF